jgi:uncharacterized caspase-like protein
MGKGIMRSLQTVVAGLLMLLFGLLGPAAGQQTERRIALVIGNGAYSAAPLQTPANDAGLIAQTLQAAGFDVVGARDLDQDSLRRAFRDFHDKAAASGPDTVAFIFLSGYGVQFEGENYFVPVDAKIDQASDVPAQAIRISDYLRPLDALKLKATIVVLDAARPNQFAQSGSPLAGGLALVEPVPGTLVAFNAAPGTVAPEGPGPYGAYAKALVEMIRDGGLPLNDLFDRTRLRVNEATKGAEVPWDASRIDAPFTFFVRAPDAPPPAVSDERTSELRSKPIRDFDAREAYVAALERDTLQGYLDFIAAYPDDPMAKRVRAIVAARREAIIWRRTRLTDTPRAYWSYLRRYPRGPHAYDARRRLEELAAALEPPPSFEIMEYDVPPPPPDEIIYIDRPVIYFDDPVFGFAPPPPAPVIFLPPEPVYIVELPPPPPPVLVFVLPIPVYQPVPVWVQAPAYIAPPPPTNIIYSNIHNTVVINNTTNTVTITNPAGQTRTLNPPAPAPTPGGTRGTAPAGAVLGPALPPSLANKATPVQSQPAPGAGNQPNRGTGQQPRPPLGQPLPGAQQGQPLPRGGAAPGPKGAQPPPPIGRQPPGGPNKPTRPLPPPPAVRHPPPPPPPAARPPSPPPPAVRPPSPPPPGMRHPPPPAARPPSPPPPAVRHPPPPPPPVARPPSPPPPAVRPPPAARPPSPPPAVRPPPPPAARPPSPPPPTRQPARGPTRPNCGGPGQPPCPR